MSPLFCLAVESCGAGSVELFGGVEQRNGLMAFMIGDKVQFLHCCVFLGKLCRDKQKVRTCSGQSTQEVIVASKCEQYPTNMFMLVSVFSRYLVRW